MKKLFVNGPEETNENLNPEMEEELSNGKGEEEN